MSFLKNLFSFAHSLFTLTRFFLSISVGFSGWVSYLKYSGRITSSSLLIFAGIFLLAAGASALNQYQERVYDARMNRTMKRPLPSGLISGSTSLFISFILIMPGLLMLFFYGSIGSAASGLFSILWYNLLYTYLKMKTPYALFPGVLTGMIPILIGWLAAGGTWYDKDCLLIAAFMCIWQIPHFLLLLLHFHNDYMKAGFPLLTKIFSRKFLGNLIISAVVAMALLMFGFIYFEIIYSVTLQFIAILITAIMLINIIRKVKDKQQKDYKYSMIMLNTYMLLIMLLILTGSLLDI